MTLREELREKLDAPFDRLAYAHQCQCCSPSLHAVRMVDVATDAILPAIYARIRALPSPWSQDLWECDPSDEPDLAVVRGFCKWCYADIRRELKYSEWVEHSCKQQAIVPHPSNGCLWAEAQEQAT